MNKFAQDVAAAVMRKLGVDELRQVAEHQTENELKDLQFERGRHIAKAEDLRMARPNKETPAHAVGGLNVKALSAAGGVPIPEKLFDSEASSLMLPGGEVYRKRPDGDSLLNPALHNAISADTFFNRDIRQLQDRLNSLRPGKIELMQDWVHEKGKSIQDRLTDLLNNWGK